jgi:hypothetical protein
MCRFVSSTSSLNQYLTVLSEQLRGLWDTLKSVLYEVYRKVPGLDPKRNASLTYLILAAISLKIVSLGTYTAIPSFFRCFRSTVEVTFCNAIEYLLRFPLDVRHCFKTSSLQFHFGKQRNHRGLSLLIGRMVNDNHVVVSHKLCGFQGRVGG